jgi:hypothetical protein
MNDPVSDSFVSPTAQPADDGGYAAQVVRYERFLGWVLWSGLLGLLVLMSL